MNERYDNQGGTYWFGSLPTHWEARRGKTLFRQVRKPVRLDDEVVTCFRDGQVTLRSNRRLDGFTVALKEVGYQGVDPGDLVIHQMDAFAGAVGVSDSRGKCSPAYAVCQPTGDADPAYFAYVLRHMAAAGWIQALSRGIRERSTDFRFERFAAQVLPVPPHEEQRAISRYLDETMNQIRRAIEAKQRLLSLLEEEEQAIIVKAVTKGLRSANLVESGAAWLGETPEHWELVPCRAVLRRVKRPVAHRVNELELLSLTKHGVIPRDLNGMKGKFPESFDTYQVIEPGDFVFCLFDVDETPRTVGLSRHHGMITGAYDVFRPIRGNPEYLYYQFLAFDMQKSLKPLYRGLRKTIPAQRFAAMKLTLPPAEEQAAIVAYVNDQVQRIDAAINTSKRMIDLLEEYRKALIADAVLGRLDVDKGDVSPRYRDLESLPI